MIETRSVPDAALRAIAERGFAVVPAVTGPADVAALRTDLERAIGEDLVRWKTNPHYRDANMVMNLMTRGDSFLQLLENPVIHAYASALLGPACILFAYTSSSMPAGGTNYARRVHVDAPRWIPGYVTNVGFTLALDDFMIENGAMSLLPGSHLVPEAPDDATFDADAETPLPRAGEMIVFNARTFHRGGVNRTNRIRHAVTMNVCRPYMRQQFDYPRLVSAELFDRLGPVGRRFLGFDVRMPTSLEEYYVPEDARLYKAGQG
ncbi:MAG: Phytanoyl-CoA dioxygenase [Candidatus Eremiobacteraeota bacterium]|nr:Phytanoyl-CoA dioxygenase [Candidatus Eremiobacteraeota bacterium]